jgi:polysaccharide export outer membrane protein
MQHGKLFFALSSIFVIVFSLTAQEPQRQFVVAPVADLNPSSNLPLQRVGPEDLLGLNVYDAPEFTRTVRISSEGTIRLPMMRTPIRVAGLMPNEIEVLIQEALQRENLFVDPLVTVNIVEYHSRPISVTGAVRAPIMFQAIGRVTLLDALARAGGVVPDQAGSEIIITHTDSETSVQTIQHIPVKALMNGTDPALNLKLGGGEEIRVPDVGKIVVAGSVVHPGPYPVLDTAANTVTTAIAQAQGTVQFYSHTAYIYRPDEKGVMHEIKVDLGKILARKEPDQTLQARDILYVPDSSGRRITQTTLNSITGLGASATSALIYMAR